MEGEETHLLMQAAKTIFPSGLIFFKSMNAFFTEKNIQVADI